LDEDVALDASACPDDRIARTGHDPGILIDRAGVRLQFPDEAGVHAPKASGFRFAEIEVGEQSPDCDEDSREKGMLNVAEPTHESRHELTRDTIREQEIYFFNQKSSGAVRSHCHVFVKMIV
jgi:hypothetical protein